MSNNSEDPFANMDDFEPTLKKVSLDPDQRKHLAERSAELGFPSRQQPLEEKPVVDGRSLRRTGRVAQMNIKVTPEIKVEFFKQATGKPAGAFIEELLETYKRSQDI